MTNKSTIIGVIILLLLAAGAYFMLSIDKSEPNGEVSGNTATFSSGELGLEFDYKTGPNGYVLQEMIPTEQNDALARVIMLFRTEDTLMAPPEGGEGPPVMAVLVFDNDKKQFPQAWADENIQYSNINLKMGDVSEAIVGGANAIRYMADGLYASENAVVAHGDSMFVITGQFIDQDSDLRRDFGPLVQSIRFIPKAGQE